MKSNIISRARSMKLRLLCRVDPTGDDRRIANRCVGEAEYDVLNNMCHGTDLGRR